MYYLVFILLLIFSMREIYTGKTNKFIFYTVYFSLIFIAAFRFGQNGDYFAYGYLYNNENSFDKDIGYSLLTEWFSKMGIPYIAFVAFFGIVTMLFFYPFFANTCKKSMIPLIIFYTYIFFIYPTGGMRQGFTLGFLVGILFPLLVKKKYTTYYLLLILGCTFHLSMAICALFPWILRLKISKQYLWLSLLIFTLLIPLSQYIGGFISSFMERGSGYLEENTYSTISIIVRILIITSIIAIPKRYFTESTTKLRNILFAGYVFYALLSSSSLIAARIEVYYRIFEGIFLFILLKDNPHSKFIKQFLILFIFMYIILWFKTLNVLADSIYDKQFNMFNYPFMSIFNIDKAINLL